MMTRRERMTAIFGGRVPDRPAVKLWGADRREPSLHPAYKPVYEAALEKTDLFIGAHSPFHLHYGSVPPTSRWRRPSGASESGWGWRGISRRTRS